MPEPKSDFLGRIRKIFSKRPKSEFAVAWEEGQKEKNWAIESLKGHAQAGQVKQSLDVNSSGQVVVRYGLFLDYKEPVNKELLDRLVKAGFAVSNGLLVKEKLEQNLDEELREINKNAGKQRRELGDEFKKQFSFKREGLDVNNFRWVVRVPNLDSENKIGKWKANGFVTKYENPKDIYSQRASNEKRAWILTQAGEIAVGEKNSGTYSSYPKELII